MNSGSNADRSEGSCSVSLVSLLFREALPDHPGYTPGHRPPLTPQHVSTACSTPVSPVYGSSPPHAPQLCQGTAVLGLGHQCTPPPPAYRAFSNPTDQWVRVKIRTAETKGPSLPPPFPKTLLSSKFTSLQMPWRLWLSAETPVSHTAHTTCCLPPICFMTHARIAPIGALP